MKKLILSIVLILLLCITIPNVVLADRIEPDKQEVDNIDLNDVSQDIIEILEYFSEEYDSKSATTETVLALITDPFLGLYEYSIYPGNNRPEIFEGQGHLSDPILDKLSYRDGYYYHEMFNADRIEWIAEKILNSPLPNMTETTYINNTLVFYKGAYYQQYGDGGSETPEITINSLIMNGNKCQVVYKYKDWWSVEPAETRYAILQPKKIDGVVYWSVLNVSKNKIFDNSNSGFSNLSAIKIMLNGSPLAFTEAPYMANGTTMVPMRVIFEALKAEVNYDAATQKITATKGDTVIELVLGQKSAKKNGQAINLDVAAATRNGNTMVPLRFVAEALSAKVDWDNASQTVSITLTE